MFHTLGSQRGKRHLFTSTMVGSWSELPLPTPKLYPEKYDVITHVHVKSTMQSYRCCDISFKVTISSCASFNITEHSPYFSCHSETYTPQSHDSHMTGRVPHMILSPHWSVESGCRVHLPTAPSEDQFHLATGGRRNGGRGRGRE